MKKRFLNSSYLLFCVFCSNFNIWAQPQPKNRQFLDKTMKSSHYGPISKKKTNNLCKVSFFPPKFSFPEFKRKIWREKITLHYGTNQQFSSQLLNIFGPQLSKNWSKKLILADLKLPEELPPHFINKLPL